MEFTDGNTTNPCLLRRVVDWGDVPAWNEFFDVYDPLVGHWCGSFGLNNNNIEELRQRIWIELSGRIRTFQYDPTRSFRGWLRRLVQFRALDLLRELKADRPRSLDDAIGPGRRGSMVSPDDELDDIDPGRPVALIDLAERAQAAVRARVAADSWHAFWLIAIEDWTIRDVSQHLGKKYGAVFMVHQRVGRMLRAEGERLMREASELAASPANGDGASRVV